MLARSRYTVGGLGAVSALVLLFSFTVNAVAQDKNPGHAKLDGPLNSVSEAFAQGGAAGAQSAAQSHGLASRIGGRVTVILEANDSQEIGRAHV